GLTTVAGGTLTSSGTLTTDTFLQTAGSTTVTGGTFKAASGAALLGGTFDVTGGTAAANGVGLINNGAAITVGAAGTLTATEFAQTSGSTTNAGTMAVAGLTTVAGGTLTSSGTLTTAGFTQTNGSTTVTGGTFTAQNGATVIGGSVDVTGGTFKIGGSGLTNGATINVGAGGILDSQAGGINNLVTGTLTNFGTVFDALNNAGSVSNAGVYNGDVATNTGTIANNVGGTWNGAVDSNTGTINNTGTWNALGGNIVNNAGGTFNNFNGTVAGVNTLTNLGVLTYTGNNNTFNVGTFINTGIISSNTTITPASAHRMTITGGLGGIGVINTSVDTNGTSRLTVNGASSGAQTMTFTNVSPGGATPVYAAPQTVLALNGGGSLAVTNTGIVSSLSSGLINNYLVQSGGGQNATLQSVFNSGPIAGVAGGLSSMITSLNAGFFQGESPIVSRPNNPQRDQINGGPWVRIMYGSTNTNLGSTTYGLGAPASGNSQGTTAFSGVQVGADFGMFNISDSQWNVIVGVFGGYANLNTNSNFTTPLPGGATSSTNTGISVEVPYVAAYANLSKGSFSAEVDVRYDQYSGTVRSFSGDLAGGAAGGYLLAPNTPLNGRGVTVNAKLANRFDFNQRYYVEPLLGFTWGTYNFDSVAFNPALTGTSGSIGFQPITSLLGRAGASVGATFEATPTIQLGPFLQASVWNEFAAPVQATATINTGGSAYTFQTLADRVGTFGQVAAGLNFKLTEQDFLGFVRGDYRFGGQFSGASFNIGLRKQF
ncbi:beta strand repeat-containing protein, partial [Reyranella sp.]|uniref:beta strand repeat-containing protein n=1 Tax=Reyranella sp. TaxID=1929291 RepID=UPI004035E358